MNDSESGSSPSKGLEPAAIIRDDRVAIVHDGENMPWADEIVWHEIAHKSIVDEMVRKVPVVDEEEFDYDVAYAGRDIIQLIDNLIRYGETELDREAIDEEFKRGHIKALELVKENIQSQEVAD